MNRKHIDHRYSQAETAFRKINGALFDSGLTPTTKAAMKRKADQMSRICRRCQRMIGAAS